MEARNYKLGTDLLGQGIVDVILSFYTKFIFTFER